MSEMSKRERISRSLLAFGARRPNLKLQGHSQADILQEQCREW